MKKYFLILLTCSSIVHAFQWGQEKPRYRKGYEYPHYRGHRGYERPRYRRGYEYTQEQMYEESGYGYEYPSYIDYSYEYPRYKSKRRGRREYERPRYGYEYPYYSH